MQELATQDESQLLLLQKGQSASRRHSPGTDMEILKGDMADGSGSGDLVLDLDWKRMLNTSV